VGIGHGEVNRGGRTKGGEGHTAAALFIGNQGLEKGTKKKKSVKYTPRKRDLEG